MCKRVLWVIIILTLSAGVLVPAAAQDGENLLAWIPADFAGFVRLKTGSADTLSALNVAAYAASFLQPARGLEPVDSLDDLVSLAALDVDDASFQQDILPWLGDELIIAYHHFGPHFTGTPDSAVLLLPTRDALQSASSLQRILRQQDILERDSYRGTTLYLADKTTLAFTPTAVLVGPTEYVQAMLDTQAGETPRLIDRADFPLVTANLPVNAVASGYLIGAESLRALSVLLEGSETAQPILQNLGAALNTYRQGASLEQRVLTGALDGIGFYLQADTLRLNSVRLTLRLHDAELPNLQTTDFNTALLDLLPQNAMLVQTGTDLPGAVYTLLTALPLSNFAGQVIGAFPIQETPVSANALLPLPDANALERAVGGLLRVLVQETNFDLDHDLLQYFNGSYALALLPRPNDPLPPLNLPYDILLIAEVDNPDTALANTAQLARTLLALDALESQTISGWDFQTYQPQPGSDPALQIGLVDDRLIVATGSALRLALDARRGDDRLVSRERWQEVSRDALPQLYVDIPAMYSTFLPQLSGPQLQQIRRLGLRTDYRGNGLFELRLLVTLPGQFS